jgi:hypothetical protein
VRDPSGAAVPAAKITAADQDTNAHQQTASTRDGSFEFPVLEPGTYRIEVDAPGFATKVLDQFELTVAEQAEQIVKAGEESARVQTGDAQISRVITMREIETLPQ